VQDVDWRELTQRIYRFFAAGCAPEQAADLTQETLKRAFEKYRRGQINHDRGTIQALTYGIAVNVRREQVKFSARQRLRVVNGEDFEALPDVRPTPEEALTISRRLSRLKAAISQLSAAEQEVVCLMVDAELSVLEVSKILKMPPGTVKSHMSRAKARLRQWMQ
jgi:RNA polymerase sigma-70 factor (ECF subfamily)